MTKEQAENYLCEVLVEFKIPLKRAGWLHPSEKALGFCHYYKTRPCRLFFHPIILRFPKYLIRQVVIHEVAHARSLHTDRHNKKWLKTARDLGYVFNRFISIGPKQQAAWDRMIARSK